MWAEGDKGETMIENKLSNFHLSISEFFISWEETQPPRQGCRQWRPRHRHQRQQQVYLSVRAPSFHKCCCRTRSSPDHWRVSQCSPSWKHPECGLWTNSDCVVTWWSTKVCPAEPPRRSTACRCGRWCRPRWRGRRRGGPWLDPPPPDTRLHSTDVIMDVLIKNILISLRISCQKVHSCCFPEHCSCVHTWVPWNREVTVRVQTESPAHPADCTDTCCSPAARCPQGCSSCRPLDRRGHTLHTVPAHWCESRCPRSGWSTMAGRDPPWCTPCWPPRRAWRGTRRLSVARGRPQSCTPPDRSSPRGGCSPPTSPWWPPPPCSPPWRTRLSRSARKCSSRVWIPRR